MSNKDVINVGVYARVSTDKSDQKNSFENQKQFFEQYISNNDNYKLYKVYTDEGVSGTSTKKRIGFNSMIYDALCGKIKLILTKEVSRFARNTVDVLMYTRKLKEKGVGILFLSDNIDTRECDGELRLSIMASIAQEESRKTSRRVKFGQREQMKKGVVFGRNLLGYNVSDGNLYINEYEANIVRSIFRKYTAEYKSIYEIASELSKEKIPTKTGKSIWNPQTIRKILKNEKYVGDLCQQKTYTPDWLTHKKVYNKGEQEFIYIKNHHSDLAIIDRDIWNKTQEMLKSRGSERCVSKNRHWTSKIVFCGECGKTYIKTSVKRKDSSRYDVLKCSCNNTYGKRKCLADGTVVGCDNNSINLKVLNKSVEFVLEHIDFCNEKLVKDIAKSTDFKYYNYIKDILNFNKQHNRDEIFKSVVEKIIKYKDNRLDIYIKGISSPIKICYKTFGKMQNYNVYIMSIS